MAEKDSAVLTHRTERRLRVVILFGVMLCSVSNGLVAGMFGVGKKYDVSLSPEVRGSITLGGEPVAGLTIMREVIYDDAHVETVKTGSDGSFYFPALNIRSSVPGRAFDETRTRQVLVTEYLGEKYILWVYGTGDIEEEPVIAEKLSDLQCDLNDEKRAYHFTIPDYPSFTHNILSICQL